MLNIYGMKEFNVYNYDVNCIYASDDGAICPKHAGKEQKSQGLTIRSLLLFFSTDISILMSDYINKWMMTKYYNDDNLLYAKFNIEPKTCSL